MNLSDQSKMTLKKAAQDVATAREALDNDRALSGANLLATAIEIAVRELFLGMQVFADREQMRRSLKSKNLHDVGEIVDQAVSRLAVKYSVAESQVQLALTNAIGLFVNQVVGNAHTLNAQVAQQLLFGQAVRDGFFAHHAAREYEYGEADLMRLPPLKLVLDIAQALADQERLGLLVCLAESDLANISK